MLVWVPKEIPNLIPLSLIKISLLTLITRTQQIALAWTCLNRWRILLRITSSNQRTPQESLGQTQCSIKPAYRVSKLWQVLRHWLILKVPLKIKIRMRKHQGCMLTSFWDWSPWSGLPTSLTRTLLGTPLVSKVSVKWLLQSTCCLWAILRLFQFMVS